MATLQTLTGTVDSAQLGRTLMHEHIFNLTWEVQGPYPGHNGWDPEVEVPKAQEKLRELKAAGYDTMVELSVLGLGRDIPLMLAAVEGSGLNVICATGLYTYESLPRLWHFSGPGTLLNGPEPLDDMFLRDIEEGMQGTAVKAGMLKCAIDHEGMTDHVERVMRACCRVHHETDVPMTIHTHPGTHRGTEALELLRQEGVDHTRVVLAHCGDSTEVDHLEELAQSGALLGFDRFGLDVLLPMEERVTALVELLNRGLADRIILSHDANCFSDWFPPGLHEQVSPRWHYLHIEQDVLPALRERGVTDEQITQMLEVTPRDFFERTSR
jgi:phosphotriesterase-related protein